MPPECSRVARRAWSSAAEGARPVGEGCQDALDEGGSGGVPRSRRRCNAPDRAQVVGRHDRDGSRSDGLGVCGPAIVQTALAGELPRAGPGTVQLHRFAAFRTTRAVGRHPRGRVRDGPAMGGPGVKPYPPARPGRTVATGAGQFERRWHSGYRGGETLWRAGSLVALVVRPAGPAPEPAISWLLASCAGAAAPSVSGGRCGGSARSKRRSDRPHAEVVGLVRAVRHPGPGRPTPPDRASAGARRPGHHASITSAGPRRLDDRCGEENFLRRPFGGASTPTPAARPGGLPLRVSKDLAARPAARCRDSGAERLAAGRRQRGTGRRAGSGTRNIDGTGPHARSARAGACWARCRCSPVFELAPAIGANQQVIAHHRRSLRWLASRPRRAAGMVTSTSLRATAGSCQHGLRNALAEPRGSIDATDAPAGTSCCTRSWRRRSRATGCSALMRSPAPTQPTRA